MALFATPGSLSRRAEFYYQLGSQIDAGFPLIAALQTQLKRPLSRSLVAPIEELIQWLESGHPLADSLERVRGWLPVFDIALLRAGEQTGRLGQTLRTLAEYYRERSEMTKQVMAYSLYPLLVLHVALLVFPMSVLQGVMTQPDGLVLFVIQKAIAFGVLWGGIVAMVVVTQREGGDQWTVVMESVLHRVPGLGTARRHLALGRFSLALESLLSAGVNVIEAWQMGGKACGSPAILRAVDAAVPGMEEGRMPSEMVNEQRVFPEMFANLYLSGESSGKLDETLERLARHYREEGMRKMKIFAFWAPNILYGALVLAIAYQILKFYLGHFQQIRDVL